MEPAGAPEHPELSSPPRTTVPRQKTPLAPCQAMPCLSEASSNFSRHRLLPIDLSFSLPSLPTPTSRGWFFSACKIFGAGNGPPSGFMRGEGL